MSFYTTCALTQNLIRQNDEVVMIILTKSKYDRSYGISPWAYWKPIPILFEGKYDSYGSLENARLFQSLPFLSESQLYLCEQFLLSHMSQSMCGENNELLKTENISQFFNQRSLFVKTEAPNIRYFKNMLKEMTSKNGILFNEDKETLKLNHLETPEALTAYIQDNDKPILNPVTTMFLNKKAFMAFSYEYGMKHQYHEFASDIQTLRHADLFSIEPNENLQMFFDCANTYGKWGNGNMPLYDYNKTFNSPEFSSFSEKKAMEVLSQIQALDLMLLNHYFGLMGQQFEPTSSVTESALDCGYQSSYDLRQRLRFIK